MNKVNKHIKQMMLQFPSLFPNRIKCLRQLFLVNGNGYDWDENGCLVSWSYENDRVRDEDKMHYDDLDTRANDLDNLLGKSDAISNIRKFQKLTDEKERLDRQFREKHIDLLCQFHDTWDNFTYADLQHFDPRWSVFRDAPYGNIDSDWRRAMEETVGKLKYAFNVIWSLHYDNPLRGEKGKMVLIETENGYQTVTTEQPDFALCQQNDILEVVYENGVLIRDMTFDEVRANAQI